MCNDRMGVFLIIVRRQPMILFSYKRFKKSPGAPRDEPSDKQKADLGYKAFQRYACKMATGSGKTYTAVNFVYRLIKLSGARRVLFLVDRGNLGDQTLKEFQQFVTPDDGRKFTELYNVQHLQTAQLDRVSRVCISTIQRLYSMLRGEEIDAEEPHRPVLARHADLRPAGDHVVDLVLLVWPLRESDRLALSNDCFALFDARTTVPAKRRRALPRLLRPFA